MSHDNELYEALRRYVTRLLGDPDAARDITQEVFLRLEQQKGTVQQVRAWSYRTARNLVLNRFRNKSAQLGHAEALDELPADATRFNPVLLAEKKETLQMIQDKMNDLPPRQREVLRLKFQEGLKYAEIADVLNEPVTTVGWLIHEALAKLRTEFSVSNDQT